MSGGLRTALLAAGVLLAGLGAAVWALARWQAAQGDDRGLRERLADVVVASAADIVPCDSVAPADAMVLLALGQSNAANHGTRDPTSAAIAMVTAEGCVRSREPLPGGTGRGGSIWPNLPAALAAANPSPPVLMSVLAVDSTTMSEWTAEASPLRARLDRHLQRMALLGRPPTLVLWHQGESDARLGTTGESYRQGLRTLADLIQARAGPVRLLLARSTICRSAGARSIREAVERQVAEDPRFGLGPDLDHALTAAERSDGCHLTARGASHAATLWADAIRADRLGGMDNIRRPS